MTQSNQRRAERLNGVTERRSVGLTDFELRTKGNTLEFRGYASLFDVGYEMYGGPDKGGWIERVRPQAFNRTLAAKPDVVLNMNHGTAGTGLPIARTTSGTLQLRTDSKGLLTLAPALDLRDPDVQALQVKMERGDLGDMSFAFRTLGQSWNDEETERDLTELSLDKGDVSIVTNGAQPKTSSTIRSFEDAIAALLDVDPEQAMAEIRALDDKLDIAGAHSVLGELLKREGVSAVGPNICETCGLGFEGDVCPDCGADADTGVVRSATPRLTLAHARRLAQLDI
jgi:HK97 family phage prohead protease